jgi:hypothetical protein
MADVKSKVAEMKAEIEQLRDEVKLKAHLGKTRPSRSWENWKKSMIPFLPSINRVPMKLSKQPKTRVLRSNLQRMSSKRDTNASVSSSRYIEGYLESLEI